MRVLYSDAVLRRRWKNDNWRLSGRTWRRA